MSDRERSRSRSPDRGEPPVKSEPNDAPPAATNGDDAAPPAAPQYSNGDSAAANTGGDGATGGEEVKLYVGNLDYGTSGLCALDFLCLLSVGTKWKNAKVIGRRLTLDMMDCG